MKGWPDVQLPVARNGYIGLAIELKVGKNKTSPDQDAVIDHLRSEGWLVFVLYDWIVARDEILKYLAPAKQRPACA